MLSDSYPLSFFYFYSGRNHSHTKNEHQHTTRSKSPDTTNEQKVNTSEQKQKVNTSAVLYGNKPDKPKKISTLPMVKNLFKSAKNTETPPIPTNHQFEDDDFMVENFNYQPTIPSRATIIDQVSAGPQRSDDEPAVPPRTHLLDNAFVQGLETVAEVSGKDAPNLGEGHYQPLMKRKEPSDYQPISTCISGPGQTLTSSFVMQSESNSEEGHYQPLMKRKEPSDYQPISTCISGPGQTLTSSFVMQSESNSEEGHYQALVRKQEENTYQSVTLHRDTVV